jgi:membrane-associated phospholipid phosphatase
MKTYLGFSRLISGCSTPVSRCGWFLILTMTLTTGTSAQEPTAVNTGGVVPTLSAALPDAPSSALDVQSSSFGEELGHGVLIIGKDELTFIKAPFQKKNLKWDLVIGAATAALISTDVSVTHQVNPAWHDTSINISQAMVYSTAASAGGIFLTGLITDNTHAKDTGVAAARGAIDSAILYGAMKLVFARERPYSANGDGSFFSGNFSSGSFPSGHSTLAWTLASVIAHEYPKWPVAVLMYGMATAASTTRVTGGEHFPSDVVVGGAFGYLIGRYVAKQDNHLPGDPPTHQKGKMVRVEDAVLSHVSFSLQ